jgi:hypothetical protein
MKLTGENRSTRGKACPSATLSTTNPIRNDPGSNPGLRGERPATDRLSHGPKKLIQFHVMHTLRCAYIHIKMNIVVADRIVYVNDK